MQRWKEMTEAKVIYIIYLVLIIHTPSSFPSLDTHTLFEHSHHKLTYDTLHMALLPFPRTVSLNANT